MKRKILLSILILSSLFAKTELSVHVGSNSYDSDENLKTATTLGVRADFYLDDLYHIDLGYDYLGDNHSKDKTILEPVTIHRLYTQFSADGAEEYHVVPTLSIGAGYEFQDGYKEDSNPFLSLGIGFRYNITSNFNFLLGTKALWKMTSNNINYHSTFGIGYLIGETAVNNEEKDVEEIIIPKKSLKIPELHSKKIMPVKIQKQIVKIPQDPKVSSIEPKSIVVSPKTPSKTIIVQKDKIKKERSLQPSKGIYIQVAAFTQYQPTSLLNKLSTQNYHIILRHQGKVTKALVGPYISRDRAIDELIKIKQIVPKAFIYKEN